VSPAEQALVDASPTFADLCERVREARRAHDRVLHRASVVRDELEKARQAAREADEALNAFIVRETTP
jgi:hypothetical protein